MNYDKTLALIQWIFLIYVVLFGLSFAIGFRPSIVWSLMNMAVASGLLILRIQENSRND